MLYTFSFDVGTSTENNTYYPQKIIPRRSVTQQSNQKDDQKKVKKLFVFDFLMVKAEQNCQL